MVAAILSSAVAGQVPYARAKGGNMRALIITLTCMALGACNNIVHATLPSSEIIKFANLPFSLTATIQARVMIQVETSCEEDKEAIMPALERYGHNVRYRGCADWDRFWEDQVQISSPYSFIHVDMWVEMTQFSNISDVDPKGLFGIGFTPMENGRTDLFFITTERLELAEKEIRENMGAIAETTRKISIVFENDTDDEIGFEFGPATVDGAEISRGDRIIVPGNASITVVPFDDHIGELLGDNPEKFASILVSP